ncbi:septum site-determining protein MinC [Trinickia dinghuensis]|uniref:Probable septum site-determining protein MinC n=1 Tax=Trinickia dinghuensis TaxID=2291023 RepID=A0A3D8JSR8_9BURK|nr:septum site-determining protein MinC [Trinickia dinghuensis]RDU95716.1 septum site-determining protein MinC [Trinickia dinghuensis]
MSLNKTPFFELRSGSVDALQFVVKTTDLDALKNELTRRFEATPEFFSGEVVTIDLRRLGENERASVADIAQLLGSVRMRPIGVVAAEAQRAWATDGGLPIVEARDRRGAGSKSEASASAADTAAAQAQPAPAAASTVEPNASARVAVPPQTLIVDKPLRSGQQIYAKGDLVVLGLVSYGAEVIAEGNIHIYAPLRGRALAGVHGNHDARIFCTCLEPELISIAGIYRTTENPLPADVIGKSVQIRLSDEKLMIEPLRLT